MRSFYIPFFAAATLVSSNLAIAQTQTAPSPQIDDTDYFCFVMYSGLNTGIEKKAERGALSKEDLAFQKEMLAFSNFFLGRISTAPVETIVAGLNSASRSLIAAGTQPKTADVLAPCINRMSKFKTLTGIDTLPHNEPGQ